MRIKGGFVLSKVGPSYLAVAVGGRADEFHAVVRMNEVGAFLWNLLYKKEMTREELLSSLLAEYDVDEQTAKRDIAAFEKQLSEGGLLDG